MGVIGLAFIDDGTEVSIRMGIDGIAHTEQNILLESEWIISFLRGLFDSSMQ
jgi:hypothetical protein